MMTKVFVLQRGRDIWGQLCEDSGRGHDLSHKGAAVAVAPLLKG